jgi:metallo-beta-lactamase class B
MRSLLAVILLCAAAAFAQSDPESRAANQPVEPFRIIGNIYYVGASDVASYLIATPQGHILIDGGFVETAPMIERNIAKLGFDLHDVHIILNSHAHFDHAGGIAEVKKRTFARLYVSAPSAAEMARGGRDDPQFGDRFLYPPVTADNIIDDGDHVTLGGTTLTAHLTPGHTKGCTTWTMQVRREGVPYNVVFVGSPTGPSEYRLVRNPSYPDEIDDYLRQFEVLKSLPCDVFLGAHGSYFDLTEKRKRLLAGDVNAFIDPDGYRKFVAAAEKHFIEVAEAQLAHGR